VGQSKPVTQVEDEATVRGAIDAFYFPPIGKGVREWHHRTTTCRYPCKLGRE